MYTNIVRIKKNQTKIIQFGFHKQDFVQLALLYFF